MKRIELYIKEDLLDTREMPKKRRFPRKRITFGTLAGALGVAGAENYRRMKKRKRKQRGPR